MAKTLRPFTSCVWNKKGICLSTVKHSTFNRPSRPKFYVTKEQLEYLSSMSSWTQIAKFLGVSRMTVYRRRVEFGLLSDPTTSISSIDLLRIQTMCRSGRNYAVGSIEVHGSPGYTRTAQKCCDKLTPWIWHWGGEVVLQGGDLIPCPVQIPSGT